jgi:hypothetical protein
LSDLTKWIQIFAGSNEYVYYNLGSFLISRIKNYDHDVILYAEWFSFDSIQKNQSRQVMGFFGVLGNVGGIQ